MQARYWFPLPSPPLYGPLVSEDSAVSVGAVVRLLAQPARLRVFSALVLGACTPAEVVAATGLEMREVVVGLRRLADGGQSALRNASTSAAYAAWCWHRNPCAASG